jgi:RNA recognition motif-containing protein
MRLFVGNIPFSTTEAELRDFFTWSGYEPIDLKIVMEYDTESGAKRSRGFAFLDVDLGDAAISQLDGEELGGRKLRVRQATPRPERTARA